MSDNDRPEDRSIGRVFSAEENAIMFKDQRFAELREIIRSWLARAEAKKALSPAQTEAVLPPLVRFVAALPQFLYGNGKIPAGVFPGAQLDEDDLSDVLNPIVRGDARLYGALKEALSLLEIAIGTSAGQSEKSARRDLQDTANMVRKAISVEVKKGAPSRNWRHAKVWDPMPDKASDDYAENEIDGGTEASGPLSWQEKPAIKTWGDTTIAIFKSVGVSAGRMETGPIVAFMIGLIEWEFPGAGPTPSAVAKLLY